MTSFDMVVDGRRCIGSYTTDDEMIAVTLSGRTKATQLGGMARTPHLLARLVRDLVAEDGSGATCSLAPIPYTPPGVPTAADFVTWWDTQVEKNKGGRPKKTRSLRSTTRLRTIFSGPSPAACQSGPPGKSYRYGFMPTDLSVG